MDRTISKRKGLIITVFALIAIIACVMFAMGSTSKASAAETTESELPAYPFVRISPFSQYLEYDEYELPLDEWIKLRWTDSYGVTLSITNKLGNRKVIVSSEMGESYEGVEIKKQDNIYCYRFSSEKYKSVSLIRRETDRSRYEAMGDDLYIGVQFTTSNYTYNSKRVWTDPEYERSALLELKTDVWYKTRMPDGTAYEGDYANGSHFIKTIKKGTSDSEISMYIEGNYTYICFPKATFSTVSLRRMEYDIWLSSASTNGFTPFFGEINSDMPPVEYLRSFKYKKAEIQRESGEDVIQLPLDKWIEVKAGSFLKFNTYFINEKNWVINCSSFFPGVERVIHNKVNWVKFPSETFKEVYLMTLSENKYQEALTTIDYEPYLYYESEDGEIVTPDDPNPSESNSSDDGESSGGTEIADSSKNTESINGSESDGKNLKGLIGVVVAVASVVVISVVVFLGLGAFKSKGRRR